MAEMRAKISALGATYVFAEPHPRYSPLIEGTKANSRQQKTPPRRSASGVFVSGRGGIRPTRHPGSASGRR